MVLGLNDLPKLLDELYDIRDKWYNLGLRLTVPTEKLESLTSHDQDSCFRQVLVDWLKSGKATWLTLCQALSHRTVGQEELAKKLQAKYPADSSSSVHQAQQNQQSTEGTSKNLPKPSSSAKEGTSSTKKRPSDAPIPMVPKKSKPPVKLPESFHNDDFLRLQPGDRLC